MALFVLPLHRQLVAGDRCIGHGLVHHHLWVLPGVLHLEQQVVGLACGSRFGWGFRPLRMGLGIGAHDVLDAESPCGSLGVVTHHHHQPALKFLGDHMGTGGQVELQAQRIELYRGGFKTQLTQLLVVAWFRLVDRRLTGCWGLRMSLGRLDSYGEQNGPKKQPTFLTDFRRLAGIMGGNWSEAEVHHVDTMLLTFRPVVLGSSEPIDMPQNSRQVDRIRPQRIITDSH